MGLFISTW
jgi:hypothetical protein